MSTIRWLFLLLLAGTLVPAFAQEEEKQDVKELGTYTVGGSSTEFEFDTKPEKPTLSKPDFSFERAGKPEFKIKLPPPGSGRAGSGDDNSASSPTFVGGANREPIPVSVTAPAYPRDAARQRIEGYVVVEFTVTATGETSDITVIQSEPRHTFDREARRAVSGWKYQPALKDGRPVPMRVQKTIRFNL